MGGFDSHYQLDNQSKKQCLGYNCKHAMKGELFPLYKVLNQMSVRRSTTNVDLVSMIGTIVFQGAE